MKLSNRSNAHFLFVVTCLLMVYVIGLGNSKSFPITRNELNSIKHLYDSVLDPPITIAETITSVSVKSFEHGPLYMVLLNVWSALTGNDLFTQRLLSLFIGQLAIVFTYRLTLLTGETVTALTAVFILAFMSFFIYYTGTVRMYSLLCLVSAWVAWSYWQVVSSAKMVHWGFWLSLVISSALILYTHYFGIMVLAAIGVYHLLFVKKDTRWFRICLAMIASGMLFAPWLPVASKSLVMRHVQTGDELPLIEATHAIASIYTNGLPILILVFIFVIVFEYRRQRQASTTYIVILASMTVLIMVVANEFAPLLIATRIRYSIVLAVPWACALAIGLNMIPKWKLVRLPAAVLWIVSFYTFRDSEDFLLFNNWLTADQHKALQYQDFIYGSASLPGQNEVILSVQPVNQEVLSRTLRYYRSALDQWRDIVHIAVSEEDAIHVFSGLSTLSTLDGIAANASGIWLIHNPQQSDLNTNEVYNDWFIRHFKSCERYVDQPDNIIEYYVNLSIPCKLTTAERPLSIHYDGGTQLSNVVIEQSPDKLIVYLRWGKTVGKEYSLSLQLFYQAGEKIRQLDRVIEGEPTDIFAFETASLREGEYTVKLIVYDFLSQQSESGVIVESQQRLQREVELVKFVVES